MEHADYLRAVRTDIRLVGLMTDDELFDGSSWLRAKRSPAPIKEHRPAPKNDPEFWERRYCVAIFNEINAMRARRGLDPLMGDGWSELDETNGPPLDSSGLFPVKYVAEDA